MSTQKTFLGFLAIVAVCLGTGSWAGAAGPYGTYLETFNSGYTLGAELRTHADWFYEAANSGPKPTAGVGVGGTVGLSDGDRIFTWEAHPFSWKDPQFSKIVLKMDFKTDGAGHFDDDRVGFMISNTDDSSSNILGVQMDPGGSGYNIEGYWDGPTSNDRRPSIVNLPTLSANTYYRFSAEIAKLTATSAGISAELWSLDGSGNPVSQIAAGSIADTSTLGDDAPHSKYFAADTIWPAYKNYTAAAPADNASAEIVPEPTALALLALGGFGAIRRRRRK